MQQCKLWKDYKKIKYIFFLLFKCNFWNCLALVCSQVETQAFALGWPMLWRFMTFKSQLFSSSNAFNQCVNAVSRKCEYGVLEISDTKVQKISQPIVYYRVATVHRAHCNLRFLHLHLPTYLWKCLMARLYYCYF